MREDGPDTPTSGFRPRKCHGDQQQLYRCRPLRPSRRQTVQTLQSDPDPGFPCQRVRWQQTEHRRGSLRKSA
jgi:hypothetical protein